MIAVSDAIAAAKNSDLPTFIACKTIIGFGAPSKQGTAATHGSPLGADEVVAARDKLNWPHEPFTIPNDILAEWRKAGESGIAEHNVWREQISKLDASSCKEFERVLSGELPDGWLQRLNKLKRSMIDNPPKLATRQASQKVLEVLVEAIPELVGGSADLTGSNLTQVNSMKVVNSDDYSGNYIHYGIREHGMAAAMNGIAQHGGIIPYGGTFLVFTDYCRPSIRLSALSKNHVIYVMTHDSIGLGEDGPTHQPVEHLASLRAIPNLLVFRPADAVETAESWAHALAAVQTPSVIVLTRQGVPALRLSHDEQNLCARGAYILAEANGKRQVSLLATGSEVGLAITAREMLARDGIQAAVISMPCWELFEIQDESYQKSVLLTDCPRVAVEAAVSQGWDRYIGRNGAFIGMNSFGASAPAGELYEHFGITAEAVAAAARKLV
jgi:transketolase